MQNKQLIVVEPFNNIVSDFGTEKSTCRNGSAVPIVTDLITSRAQCNSFIHIKIISWHYYGDNFVGFFRYTVKAFNFYVFPRPFSRQAPDIRFMCQVNSLCVCVNLNDTNT